VGLLFAGSETVANLLSETLYELALQPDLQSRVRAELEDAREAAGGTLSFDELMSAERLPLFDALCRESLRTKSPLADIARCAARDGVIPLAFALPDGSTSLHVRKGTFILVPLRDGVATNPDIWGADADVFRPERWLEHAADDRRELIRAQGNVLTFGDGARVCLGRQFAVAEYKVCQARTADVCCRDDGMLTR
jgi:cytochrome P450